MQKSLVTAALAIALVVTTLAQAKPFPAFGLNHFWAVLDDDTAEAIKHAPVLREFANFKVETVAPGDGRSWTGRYLMGRQTYAEFFALADLTNDPTEPALPGQTAIGIGVDQVGGLDALAGKLHEMGAIPQREMQKRRFGDRDVNWFAVLSFKGPPGVAEPFGVWAMEYTREFFAASPERDAPEGAKDLISRERYLNDGYKDRLMRDITEVEMAVPRADYKRHEPILRAAGFRVKEIGNRVTVVGPDADFVLLVDRAPIGLRRIDFVLNQRTKQKRVVTIGTSTLTIGPGTHATWVFETPEHNLQR